MRGTLLLSAGRSVLGPTRIQPVRWLTRERTRRGRRRLDSLWRRRGAWSRCWSLGRRRRAIAAQRLWQRLGSGPTLDRLRGLTNASGLARSRRRRLGPPIHLMLDGLYGLTAAPDLARNRWRRLGALLRLMRDCRRRLGALSRLEAWWLSRARALERARAEG